MSWLVTPEEVARVRELETQAEGIRDVAKQLKEDVGINALEAQARELEAEANKAREEWGQTYGALYECLINDGTFQMPEKPKGLSFSRHYEVQVVNAAEVPREACAPVKKLLKDGMSGTETLRTWRPRIDSE